MKKFTYSVAIAATLLASSNTFAQQGFGTNTPHRSSAVEIQSTNKGLLIPRVELTALNNAAPIIGTPQNSLLIYNTKTDLNSNLVQGYYFWKATNVDANGNSTDNVGTWIPFATGNSVANLSGANGVKRVGDVFKLGDTPIDEETILTVGAGSLKIVANDKFFINGAPQFATGDVGLLVRDQNTGLVQNMGPDQLFNNYLNGKNGVKTVYNTETTITDVKLGGTIDEVTNLHIADNASVSVTGLKKMNGTAVSPNGLDASVAALGGNGTDASTGHLIPVGTTMNGTLKVATAKEVVDAGIVSVTNTISGNGLPALTSTDRALITSVNEDASEPINMTQLVQSEQIKYQLESTNNSVGFTTTQEPLPENNYTKKIDLAVNAGAVGGGQPLASTDLNVTVTDGGATTNTALLQGLTVNINVDAVKAIHINEDVAGQGLVQETSGALKVNVNNGLEYGTLATAETAGDFVQLGGALTRATTLTATAANTLAIAGLQNTNGNTVATLGDNQFASVLVDKNGVLRTMEKSSTIALTDATTLTGYQTYYEEVIVNYTLGVTGDSDVTLALPPASVTNNGQVINLRISASSENKFLVITGADVSVEGSMPYQGWVFKSNGTTWNLVATK
jgi:hypothetical protein